MQRREFITLVAAAWPLAAHAQPPGENPQGPTAPSYEMDPEKILRNGPRKATRWRAAWGAIDPNETDAGQNFLEALTSRLAEA
jgi:hypothetical protein